MSICAVVNFGSSKVEQVCFESGPRKSSVYGSYEYVDTILCIVHAWLFRGSPRLMVALTQTLFVWAV